jgi:hypothetical protein
MVTALELLMILAAFWLMVLSGLSKGRLALRVEPRWRWPLRRRR